MPPYPALKPSFPFKFIPKTYNPMGKVAWIWDTIVWESICMEYSRSWFQLQTLLLVLYGLLVGSGWCWEMAYFRCEEQGYQRLWQQQMMHRLQEVQRRSLEAEWVNEDVTLLLAPLEAIVLRAEHCASVNSGILLPPPPEQVCGWVQQILRHNDVQMFATDRPGHFYAGVPLPREAEGETAVLLAMFDYQPDVQRHRQGQIHLWQGVGLAIALFLLLQWGLWRLILRPTRYLVKQTQAIASGTPELSPPDASLLGRFSPLNPVLNQILATLAAQHAEVRRLNGLLAENADCQCDRGDRQTVDLALHQQVVREALINKIAQRIHYSLDLLMILQVTVAEVQQFLRADRVVISQYESVYRNHVLVETVCAGYTPLVDTLLYDPVLGSDGPLSQGRGLAIAHLEQAGLPSSHVDLMQQFQVQAYLIVPIVQGDRPWGLLMAHQCREPRQWQAWEVEFMQELTIPVAIAIQQAELYDQVQRLNTDLSQQVAQHTAQLREALNFEALLKRITDRVRDSLDESQILQSVVQELAHGLEVGACLTAIYDLETREVIPQYEYTTFFSPTSRKALPLDADRFLQEQLLRENYLQYSEYHPTWGRVSLLVCPIQDDQGTLGDLRLFTFANHVFDELQIRVTQQVANQCAIAIRQARLYESAQQQVQELERLNQLKDDFLSTVSHELRTPMANISMARQMIELMLQRIELPDTVRPLVQQYLGMLENESDREINLINDLLDLSRLDAQTEPIEPITIDLRNWIAHLAEPFILRTQAQQQTLELHLDASIDQVPVDLMHLEPILSELLNNACKYTPAGEGIAIAAHAMSTMLHISVMNSGVEIQPGEFDHIFEKFYRIPNHDPWKHGGTGLGLALVKKRVTYLGGTIEVSSTQGRTIFMVHLPLRHVALLHPV